MTAILSHIAIESKKNPQYSIIWLHGLGADGNDFVPIAEEIELPEGVRYIFPHAPHRPVTINGGYVMRAWYDITSNSINAFEDEAGIHTSQAAVDALIAAEIAKGIAPDHIFLAGFSQGGAIALQCALRRELPLAGVLALSTYLPLAAEAKNEVTDQAKRIPIFMAHGRQDPVIPLALATASKVALQELGCEIAWHEYPMQHSVCDTELQDIALWLSGRMQQLSLQP